MSLKRFYGYTGLISARKLGVILFLFEILMYIIGGIAYLCYKIRELLIRAHIMQPPKPPEKPDMTYEEWYQNLEKEFEKDQIRQLEKKNG